VKDSGARAAGDQKRVPPQAPFPQRPCQPNSISQSSLEAMTSQALREKSIQMY